ncbi:MAG: VPLPA-CTERM sorting domain-containing protein [Pseudomonadota bacterium]
MFKLILQPLGKLTATLELTVGLSGAASAATMVTTGAGSAVTTADRTATFDSLITSNLNLSGYSEDGLNVTVNDVSFTPFDPFNGMGGGPNSGFHYGRGGNASFVTISSATNEIFSGVEFRVGNGNFSSTSNVVWETLLNGVSVGSGTFSTATGGFVGWTDTGGFDTLRVGAAGNFYTAFGQSQSIALDDLSAQVRDMTPPIPLPAGGLLLLSGLAGVAALKRRKGLSGT